MTKIEQQKAEAAEREEKEHQAKEAEERAKQEQARKNNIFARNYYSYGSFSDGFAIVGQTKQIKCKSGGEIYRTLYGIADRTGKEVVPLQYKTIEKICNNIYHVSEYTDCYSYSSSVIVINDTVKKYVDYSYEYHHSFSDGVLQVRQSDGLYGFIDESGKEIVPCIYKSVDAFSDGMAKVQTQDGRTIFIDKSGKEMIDVSKYEYYAYGYFKNGYAIVRKKFDKYGLIDKTGKEVLPCQYDPLNYSDGLVFVGERSSNYEFYKWGLMDLAGQKILPCKYKEWGGDMPHFTESYAILCDKTVVIDKTGKEIVPDNKYRNIENFSEGRAVVWSKKYNKNNKNFYKGYIDYSGKEIIPCIYQDAENFKDGVAIVKTVESKWILIDKTGQRLTQSQYDKIHPFSGGMAAVIINDKMGFINLSGKEVIQCKYDDSKNVPYYITEYYKGEYFCLKINGKYGIIKKSGEEVIPFIYADIDWISDVAFTQEPTAVKLDNGKWMYIDKTGKCVINCQ